jgi:hypothetical protein
MASGKKQAPALINREKAMTDAIDAIAKLEWTQLLILNAQLSEHILNVWQHNLANIERGKIRHN